jgi:hypothetical protein
MSTEKNLGRTIGVLLLAQGVGGGIINFVLLSSVIGPPGFLVNAAANPLNVSFAVLIGLVAGALSVAVAIAAFPLFRQHSQTMALWVLALGIAGLTLTVVENSTVMSLLSYSQAYAAASPADAATFEAMRVVVASSRNWAHYTHLIVGGATYLLFYAVLYRFALVPRALAAFGMLAVALQVTAVSMPIFGFKIVMMMLMPMGIAHLALALYLAVKGFSVGPKPDSQRGLSHASAA